jgi:hypothetical protein
MGIDRLTKEQKEYVEQKYTNVGDEDLVNCMLKNRGEIEQSHAKDRANGIKAPVSSHETVVLVYTSNEMYYELHRRGIYDRYRDLKEQ